MVRVTAIASTANPATKLNKQEHGGEEQKGEKRWEDH